MGWQGIPFKLLSETTDALNLSVTALPNLILKSDPDYKSAILTASVSLVAGLIPAGIAVYTFRKNSINLKSERKEQQEFLMKEREEQQRFLREERSAQSASLEADRMMQKEISEKNFNMQVLSVNRQAWINNLRNLLSEYMAVAPDFLTAQFDLINSRDYFNKALANKNKINKSGLPPFETNASYEKAVERLQKSIDKLSSCRVKEKLLTGNILLMLNPTEKWYPQLESIFNEVSTIYNSLSELKSEVYIENINKMSDQVSACLKVSQDLLKYEWERVKKGE